LLKTPSGEDTPDSRVRHAWHPSCENLSSGTDAIGHPPTPLISPETHDQDHRLPRSAPKDTGSGLLFLLTTIFHILFWQFQAGSPSPATTFLALCPGLCFRFRLYCELLAHCGLVYCLPGSHKTRVYWAIRIKVYHR